MSCYACEACRDSGAIFVGCSPDRPSFVPCNEPGCTALAEWEAEKKSAAETPPRVEEP